MKKRLLFPLLLFLAALAGCNEGKDLLVDRVDLAAAATLSAH